MSSSFMIETYNPGQVMKNLFDKAKSNLSNEDLRELSSVSNLAETTLKALSVSLDNLANAARDGAQPLNQEHELANFLSGAHFQLETALALMAIAESADSLWNRPPTPTRQSKDGAS